MRDSISGAIVLLIIEFRLSAAAAALLFVRMQFSESIVHGRTSTYSAIRVMRDQLAG